MKNLDELVNSILKRKNVNYDLLEESREVEDIDNLNLILNKLIKEETFNLIINPKKFDDIASGKNEIIKNVVLKYSEDENYLSNPTYDFLDALENASEKKFKLENNITEISRGSTVIGIDLGTTYSVASYFETGKDSVTKGKGITIPSPDGTRLFPSIVAIKDEKTYEVGSIAKRKRQSDPLNTFYSIKRFIGRRSSDINEDLKKKYPFKLDTSSERIKLKAPKKSETIDCEEISAQVLLLIKNTAEEYLNSDVNQCVITVPAYFDDNQRTATKVAAEIAGLEVLRIINEPTAAAYAYGCEKSEENSNIFVADLGGGTFDISLINFQNEDLASVISSAGDSDLGGDDFTSIIYELIIADIYKNKSNFDLDSLTKGMITEEAEKIKCELSNTDASEYTFNALKTTDNQLFVHQFKITIEEYEKATEPLLKRIENLIKEFLKEKKVVNKKIDQLVLAGGSSRIPAYRKLLKRLLNLNPKLDTNPDEVVALGASLCAEYASGSNPVVTLIDVTPISLGVEIHPGDMSVLVPKNTSLPTEKKDVYSTIEDYQDSVHIKVFQGEKPIAVDNINIGEFVLSDIERARKQVPQIEVTFRIDLDGILSVTAIDLKTNSSQKIVIENALKMSSDKIKLLKKQVKALNKK